MEVFGRLSTWKFGFLSGSCETDTDKLFLFESLDFFVYDKFFFSLNHSSLDVLNFGGCLWKFLLVVYFGRGDLKWLGIEFWGLLWIVRQFVRLKVGIFMVRVKLIVNFVQTINFTPANFVHICLFNCQFCSGHSYASRSEFWRGDVVTFVFEQLGSSGFYGNYHFISIYWNSL